MQRNVKKGLIVWTAVVAAVLMIPLLANAPWTGLDFVFAAAMLSASALTYDLATRNTSDKKHRTDAGVSVPAGIALILIWAAAGPDGQ